MNAGALHGLLGSLVAQRVYPLAMPQGCAKPAVVYTVLDASPVNCFEGHTSQLVNSYVQIDVYSPSYAEAHEVAGQIEIVLQSSRQVTRRDLYEDDTRLHRVSMDYSLWGEE